MADLIAAGVSPRALRYALISVHYRAPLNWSDDSLPAAAAAVERVDALLAALAAYREDRADDPGLPAVLDGVRAAFEAGLDDDLNVSEALAALFDGVRELNRRLDARSLSTADAARAAAFIRELDAVLGIAAPVDRRAWTRTCRRCWTSGLPPVRRATGWPPTACEMSSSPVAWPSRTRATDSAGAWW